MLRVSQSYDLDQNLYKILNITSVSLNFERNSKYDYNILKTILRLESQEKLENKSKNDLNENRLKYLK